MESIVKLFQQFNKNALEWVDSLADKIGISSTATWILIAVVVVMLLFILCNRSKHRKLKKMAIQNQEKTDSIAENIEEIFVNLDGISQSVDAFDKRLGELNTGQEKVMQDKNPSIIYIDNRQGAASDRVSTGEIAENVERALNPKSSQGDAETIKATQPQPKERPFNYEDIFKTQNYESQEPTFEKTEGARAIYTDRTSGVSKSGTEYTLEQLQKQIKD